jgi:ABC-type multidrug transport system ATPase subunit
VNGTKMNSRAMTSVAGYMLQDDVFIGSLTVREHLTFLVRFSSVLVLFEYSILMNK